MCSVGQDRINCAEMCSRCKYRRPMETFKESERYTDRDALDTFGWMIMLIQNHEMCELRCAGATSIGGSSRWPMGCHVQFAEPDAFAHKMIQIGLHSFELERISIGFQIRFRSNLGHIDREFFLI